jgi:tetratricopeptide (TPR) repeat protein
LAESFSGVARPLCSVRFSDAAQARGRAIGLYEGLAADFPNDPRYRLALADQYESLGNDRTYGPQDPGGHSTAQRLQAHRQAVAVCARLAQDFPGNRDYGLRLVRAWNVLRGSPSYTVETAEFLRQELQVRKKLVEDFNVQRDVIDLIEAQMLLGSYLERPRPQEAEEVYRQALAAYDTLPPHAMPLGRRFAHLCNHLGDLMRAAGHLPEAEKTLRRSVDFYESLPTADREIDASDAQQVARRGGFAFQPGESAALSGLHAYRSLGGLLRDARRFEEAERVYRRVVALGEKLATMHENARAQALWYTGPMKNACPCYPADLAWDQVWLGEILEAAGRPREAEQAYRQAADAFARVGADDIARFRRPAMIASYNAACYLCRGVTLAGKDAQLAETRRRELTQDYSDRAMLLLRQAVEQGFKDAALMRRDPDLNPLRAREDFRKLLAHLEGKTKE